MAEQFNTIAVIGLGYVGLPLSLQFARSGSKVIGLDIDPAKIEAINSGRQINDARASTRRRDW